jgi:hypothetical protein
VQHSQRRFRHAAEPPTAEPRPQLHS